jgi:hypothetical protein
VNIEKKLKQIANKRNKILEQFTKAYLAETGLKPSEIMLVQSFSPTEVKWWFEKKGER